MLTRRSVLSLAVLLPLAGCGAPAPSPSPAGSARPTTAAATASARGVVVFAPGALATHTKALAEAYRATGREVTFEVGHTPAQRERLAAGATPDVWISADPADMASAGAAGLVDRSAIQELASTRLVVMVPPGNPAHVTQFADLARPGLRVVIGDESLPIGLATKATLAKADAALGPGFADKVAANVVAREPGVGLIVTRVTRDEADAGLVFVTDVPAQMQRLVSVEVPAGLNTDVKLEIAPVAAAHDRAGAEAFIAWLMAGQGRHMLNEAGYLPPIA